MVTENNKNPLASSMALVFAASLLTACGGSGGGGSNDIGGGDEQSQETAYVAFWQDELSERNTVGGAIASPDFNLGVSEDASASFSALNVQVAGVNEPTEVVFDGEILLQLTAQNDGFYIAEDALIAPEPARSTVRLFSQFMLAGSEAENPAYHLVAEQDYDYKGLLSHGDKVGLIGGKYDCGYIYDAPIIADAATSIYCPSTGEQPSTMIQLWQYREGAVPLEPNVTNVHIDGAYVDARAIENKIYVVTRFQASIEGLTPYPENEQEVENNREVIASLAIEDISPSIRVDNVAAPYVAEPCEYFEERAADSSTNFAPGRSLPAVFMVTELDMNNPEQLDTICVVDEVYQTHVSNDALYLLKNDYQQEQSAVIIHKVAFASNGLQYRGQGQVQGALPHDRYFLGEVDGKLAMVNTIYANGSEEAENGPLFNGHFFYHQLSLLEEANGGLSVSAQIPNSSRPEAIGKPGESIYAVRFMKERAYVVTFEQIDPLYVIDLSNSADPVIAGEVEVPGFSEYLHVIGDDLLLGLGYNTLTEEGRTWLQGLSLRLFDVSDPGQPRVLQSSSYGQRGSYSDLSYDPHALAYLFDENSGIARLAFTARLHGTDTPDPNFPSSHYYDWTESVLLQLEVDVPTRRFSEVGRYSFASPDSGHGYWGGTQERSVIDGEAIYFVQDAGLEVLNWGASEPQRNFPHSNNSVQE